MKRMVTVFTASVGLVLAGCSKTERPAISVNGSTNAASTNAITPTTRTDEPVGPATGVGAGSAASSGMGPASAASSSAVESQQAPKAAPPVPPTPPTR